jgi:sialic acid synthase SpsE
MNFKNLKKTWIVAEIGVNHEGKAELAEEMINLAAKAGVDAVKFQTFQVEHYISTVQPDRYERTKRFQLSREQFQWLAAIAKSYGVEFFSTPFGLADVDFLDNLVSVFKISSGDLTYLELIRRVAAKGKPMILSTGLGTRQEIAAAVQAIKEVRPGIEQSGELILMHCVSAYPTPPAEANLANIAWLRDTFGLPAGYSDHTQGINACELAVAAGAVILEKHFTYRKENQAFHDHLLSADPADMTQLVQAVRQAEVYLGRRERGRGPSEEKMLLHMRRSIGAAVDIPAGQPVEREWLTYLRPAWGLFPDEMGHVVGRTLRRKVAAGDLIRKEDLETGP